MLKRQESSNGQITSPATPASVTGFYLNVVSTTSSGLSTTTSLLSNAPLRDCPTNSPVSTVEQCFYLTPGVPVPTELVTNTKLTYQSGIGLSSVVVVEILPLISTSTTSAAPSSTAAPSTATTVSPGNSIIDTPAKSTDASSKGRTLQAVSNGAIAGVAVGCFIVGALVGALVCCFLFKKRLQRNRYAARSTYLTGPEPPYDGEKGTPMVSIASVGGLDFLPQQADDAEVQRKLSTVIDQIDQHVENFYSNREIRLDAALEDDLFDFETPGLAQPLAVCFTNTTHPTILIKHCLAFLIFNLTLAPGEGTQPLLPAELASTIAAVYNKTLSPSTSKDIVAAFSSWKALTKYLRPDLMRDPSASRSANENTARIASQFTNVFSPWSNTQYSEEHRIRHLTELINHSIQAAIWLFGQPDAFRFDWSTPSQELRQSMAGRTTNTVVTVPAVFKVTHDGARLGGAGQSVLKSVVQRF